MEIPEELKEAIENQIIGIKNNSIIENAQTISQRYRNNDGKGKRLLTKKEEAISYSISRMPSTYCAIYSALEHAIRNYNTDKVKTLLDVGAGTGAATWAVNELIDIEKNICLERENVMIDVGKRLMSKTRLKSTEWKQYDLTKDIIQEKSDIVVTSYMINELSENEKETIINKLWEATKEILLIVEQI